MIFRVIAETEDFPCDEDFVQELTELASREDGLVSAVDLQILGLESGDFQLMAFEIAKRLTLQACVQRSRVCARL